MTITELYEWVKENGTQTGTTAWYGEGNDIDYIIATGIVTENVWKIFQRLNRNTSNNPYNNEGDSIKFRIKDDVINVILLDHKKALAWIYATSWMSRHMHTCPKDEQYKIKHDRKTRIDKFIYFIDAYKRGERM